MLLTLFIYFIKYFIYPIIFNFLRFAHQNQNKTRINLIKYSLRAESTTKLKNVIKSANYNFLTDVCHVWDVMFYCLFLFMKIRYVKVNSLWSFNHIKVISLLVFYFILYNSHVGNMFALTLVCLCRATKKFLEH